jgi:UDP-D-galactose:(glucosyl)LPS alpha-1,6-D-galactosyltransferase
MRIAFFCPTVSGKGGVETATRNLIAGFNELGDETRLFLLGSCRDNGWLDGVEYTQFGNPQEPRLRRLMRYAFGAIRAVREWCPDAIICSDVTTIQMARLGRFVSGRARTRIASWIHYPVANVRLKEKLCNADLHLAISGLIAEDLKVLIPRQQDRVFTIFNAVDTKVTGLIPRPSSASFLYVGRLTFDDQKRVNDLLEAVSLLRGKWTLKIVGAPSSEERGDGPRLKALASELGLDDRVEWVGWQKSAWSTAGATTALVMPSAWEGFPMVLIEALAHGTVCVSSDCKSGPSEIIKSGQNGWLFPVGDVRQLASHLQRLVDAPEELPAQEAVQKTAGRYSPPAVAQRAKDALLAVS